MTTSAPLAVTILVVGLSIGVFYALVGVGFGLLRTVGVSNLAYGDGLVLSAFVTFVVATLSNHLLLGLAAGVLVSLLMALVTERIALRPLAADPAAAIVGTTGIALIWRNLAQAPSAGNSFGFGKWWRPWQAVIGGTSVDAAMIVAAALLLACVFGARKALANTSWGRDARALGDDATGALTCGISPTRTARPLHLAAGLIGALTGFLLIAHLGAVSAGLGWQTTLIGFIAAILGGRRGPEAAAVGGLALGLAQSTVQILVGSIWAGVVSLTVLVALLMFRPSGLITTTQGARP